MNTKTILIVAGAAIVLYYLYAKSRATAGASASIGPSAPTRARINGQIYDFKALPPVGSPSRSGTLPDAAVGIINVRGAQVLVDAHGNEVKE